MVLAWATLQCADACSLRNEQDQDSMLSQSKSYDLIGITETQCDSSHDWSTAVDSYKISRKCRKGRRGVVGLYAKERVECINNNRTVRREPLFQNWQDLHQRRSHGRCLLQTSWSGPSLPLINHRSLGSAGPSSPRRLQLPWYLLGKQLCAATAMWEISVMNFGKLPNMVAECAKQEFCLFRPTVQK